MKLFNFCWNFPKCRAGFDPILIRIRSKRPSANSVVDPNTLNLDLDPGFLPNLDPDPGLYNNFLKEKFKII